MTFSGYDLASGASSSGLGEGKGPDADALIWIVLIAAIAILVLFFLYQNKRTLRKAMIPVIGLAVAGLVVMGMKFIDVQKAKSGVTDAAKSTIDSFTPDTSTETETTETDGGTITQETENRTSDKPEKKSEDFSKMMGSMIKIEWGYWLTTLSFILVIAGAWNFKNEPPLLASDDIGTPLPEDQSNINEDLGL